jgi:hypothetical protein
MVIEPLMTAREVAEAFGFPRVEWVLDQTRKKSDPLPCFRMGDDGSKGYRGPVFFRASDVEAWVLRRSSVA